MTCFYCLILPPFWFHQKIKIYKQEHHCHDSVFLAFIFYLKLVDSCKFDYNCTIKFFMYIYITPSDSVDGVLAICEFHIFSKNFIPHLDCGLDKQINLRSRTKHSCKKWTPKISHFCPSLKCLSAWPVCLYIPHQRPYYTQLRTNLTL